MKHTKLPLTLEKVQGDSYDGSFVLRDATGSAIMGDPAYYPWCPSVEVVEEMVHTANNYPALVESLKLMLEVRNPLYSGAISEKEADAQAKATLSACGEE